MNIVYRRKIKNRKKISALREGLVQETLAAERYGTSAEAVAFCHGIPQKEK